MTDPRKIVFCTGTRADFGKLKPLIEKVERTEGLEAHIFATGMHMLPKHGTTAHEILKCGFANVYFYNNRAFGLGMDISLANTIYGFSCYVKETQPDLIIVHGDRPEALAGAIVGSFNNIRVAHIEGGEVSGTIDELIRHSITKLSHVHFAANEEAYERLLQLGERPESIFMAGSPETDVMLSDELPSIEEAKDRYSLAFEDYAILVYHPVTTEIESLAANVRAVVDAVLESGLNYIVIMPNNDAGSDIILREYQRFKGVERIRTFPSIRFEYYLTLFKHSRFLIGNSSSGVREAPVYGVPSINCGTRQSGRSTGESIFTVPEEKAAILERIEWICRSNVRFPPKYAFGKGNSSGRILEIFREGRLWEIPLQKRFEDSPANRHRLSQRIRRSRVGHLTRSLKKQTENMLQARQEVT